MLPHGGVLRQLRVLPDGRVLPHVRVLRRVHALRRVGVLPHVRVLRRVRPARWGRSLVSLSTSRTIRMVVGVWVAVASWMWVRVRVRVRLMCYAGSSRADTPSPSAPRARTSPDSRHRRCPKRAPPARAHGRPGSGATRTIRGSAFPRRARASPDSRPGDDRGAPFPPARTGIPRRAMLRQHRMGDKEGRVAEQTTPPRPGALTASPQGASAGAGTRRSGHDTDRRAPPGSAGCPPPSNRAHERLDPRCGEAGVLHPPRAVRPGGVCARACAGPRWQRLRPGRWPALRPDEHGRRAGQLA